MKVIKYKNFEEYKKIQIDRSNAKWGFNKLSVKEVFF